MCVARPQRTAFFAHSDGNMLPNSSVVNRSINYAWTASGTRARFPNHVFNVTALRHLITTATRTFEQSSGEMIAAQMCHSKSTSDRVYAYTRRVALSAKAVSLADTALRSQAEESSIFRRPSATATAPNPDATEYPTDETDTTRQTDGRDATDGRTGHNRRRDATDGRNRHDRRRDATDRQRTGVPRLVPHGPPHPTVRLPLRGSSYSTLWRKWSKN